jgi:hypothetical protein
MIIYAQWEKCVVTDSQSRWCIYLPVDLKGQAGQTGDRNNAYSILVKRLLENDHSIDQEKVEQWHYLGRHVVRVGCGGV